MYGDDNDCESQQSRGLGTFPTVYHCLKSAGRIHVGSAGTALSIHFKF